MAHVQANDVSLAYGDRDILSHVTLTLASGDRCALAGANGSGKSTLMKILARLNEADSGTIVTSSDARVIYLPQSGITHRDRTLIEEIELAYGQIGDLIAASEVVAERMATMRPDDPNLEEAVHEHHELQEAILHSGYYEREADIDVVLAGLGFRASDRGRRTNEFSGGWQMRIALAKVLLQRPDFLLLDEPTNYLDVEARVWLANFLGAYSGGILMVSHDRRFLDQTVNTVWELFLAQVKRYRGTYTEYEARREQEIEQITAAWQQQQEEIARVEDFIRRFRAQATKARQVQSRIKQLEKIERIEIPEHLKHIHITFPAAPRSGKEVITAQAVTRAYGKNSVLDGVDLIIGRGERVVLVGPNGAGKSTLMRILAERDTAFSGSVKYGAEVSAGFYADDDTWLTHATRRAATAPGATGVGPTIIEAITGVARGQSDQQLRDMLGAFLFRGDEIFKPVSVLSGGERSRLAMLQLLLQPHNLLVLDEPTNHLDMSSKDVLLDALSQFGGTLVFVSHDRDFIERLATRVIELRPDPNDPFAPSIVSDFPGDYHYYAWRLEHRGEVADAGPHRAAPLPVATDATVDAKPAVRIDRAEQKALRSRAQKLERAAAELLERIEQAEKSHAGLQNDLADPRVYEDGEAVKRVGRELAALEKRIADLTHEWEQTTTELDGLV